METVNLSISNAVSIFLFFTGWFFLLLFTLLPFLEGAFVVHAGLYWFITGYFLFIPMFAFAILSVRREGSRDIENIRLSLGVRGFSKKDLKYSIVGLIFVFLCTGIIFGISAALTHRFGIRPLSTTPWFMEFESFQGHERFFLLFWFPMFFFNIAGEEILWRGYIQTRLRGNYSWLLCSFLWMVFHIPFGLDLMIVLIPLLFVIPYVHKKTENTSNAMLIHGLYNGPVFVLVALGVIQ
ncbi:CAAX protease self-immunity [Alkalispirochaeta americana]|uniref:CAAX protease self-immunity n=1 Tax=Alkalispirochaeta americana TaxID=159291 RepID=A0A1N6UIV6_9SPIO|nr:CPBP family intramembrane glutamic endopeptidase [Alkalispirochaeta americana]SIQ65559.1 CAAX protease self-immunity [Alkalispirochaeta americana]